MDGTVVSKRIGQPLCVADIAALTASVLGICLAESGITLGLDGISKVTDGVVNVVHRLAGAPMNVEAMADGTADILIRTYRYTFKAGDVVSIVSLYTEVLKSWQRRVR